VTTPEPTEPSLANSLDANLEERFAAHQARLAQMSFPHALRAGDQAPEFELPNADGRPIRLLDRLRRGPVVLTFYRGVWCPYCNLQLHGLQQALPEIKGLGASLLAVSPQLPDGSRAMVDNNGLTFEVLSDRGSFVASTYGVVFALSPDDQALFTDVGNDLTQSNGDNSWLLPAPATFVIARGGVIRHARVDADFTGRIEPDEIVAILKTIAA
jgi:peroxiredoxin